MRFKDISGVDISDNIHRVKVNDGKNTRTYWIKRADPEKAKALAIKKHLQRVGTGRTQDGSERELSAEIISPAANIPGEQE